MIKVIDCPICEDGKLQIELSENEKIKTNGRFGKYPFKAYCKKCHRFIKYDLEKKEND